MSKTKQNASESVSIHARTWRATPVGLRCRPSIRFNSRPHVAGDRRKLLVSCLLKPCMRFAEGLQRQ